MENKLLNKISQYQTIIIFGHINPDGDCYGSQVGLKEILKSLFPNKKIYAVGSGVKALYPVFGELDNITVDDFKGALGIMVDLNERARVEDERVYYCEDFMIIDHHYPSGDYEKYKHQSIVKSDYASCATLVYELAIAWNAKLNLKAVEALLYGITSDTARFLYLEENHISLKYGNELMDLGGDLKNLNTYTNMVFQSEFEIKKYILENCKEYKGAIYYCYIPYEYIQQIGYTSYAGWFVNLLANVEGHPIWALFVENSDKTLSVELRSNIFKVLDIARKYGGGGHDFAAGITRKILPNTVVDSILDDLYKLIEGE